MDWVKGLNNDSRKIARDSFHYEFEELIYATFFLKKICVQKAIWQEFIR